MKPSLFILYVFILAVTGNFLSRDSAAAAPPDSVQTQSASVDTLHAMMARSGWTKKMTGSIFRVESAAAPVDPHAEVSVSPYVAYEGRIIRNIYVMRFNVFGESEVGVRDQEISWAGRALNSLHIDTHERVIRNSLLMDRGDRLDPYQLSDTERILRATRHIQDAKIEVFPVPESADSVDIVVLTRDVWSIGASASVRSLTRYGSKIYDRNFLGLGHEFEHEFDIDTNRDRELDYTTVYRISNFYGTFIESNMRYINSYREEATILYFSRGLVSPEIKYIGGLTLIWAKSKPVDEFDYKKSYSLQDAWLGRSFPLGKNPAGGPGRTKIVVSGRAARTDYYERPPVEIDKNRPFRDKTLFLGSLSLSRSEWRKGRLIFSYGTTEDIPEGFLFGLTGGYENGEFEDLTYVGIDANAAQYWKGPGFFSIQTQLGSYNRNGNLEDIVLDVQPFYFSDLSNIGNCYLRHFLRINYTAGYRRIEDDFLRLEGEYGIDGLSSAVITGKHRLRLSMQSVLFTPLDVLTFRFAFFGFIDTGTVGSNFESFFDSKYYSSFGGGFRIHSERLVFDPLEVRLIYVPSAPEDAKRTWYFIGNIPPQRPAGFDPGPPSVVPFR